MIYGLKITEQPTGKWLATCRDVPECVYETDSRNEAVDIAGQMIPGTLVINYRHKRKPFPLPSGVLSDEIKVRVPVRIQAKMLFWNFMQTQHLKISDVARKLEISHTEASRLVDLTRDSASIDAIEKAAEQLGMTFNLTCEPW